MSLSPQTLWRHLLRLGANHGSAKSSVPASHPRPGLDQLRSRHPSAEAAAAAGEFSWIGAFARDETDLFAIALLMMGNVAGARRLFGILGEYTPRGRLFSALCRWVEGAASFDVGALPETSARSDFVRALVPVLGRQQVRLLLLGDWGGGLRTELRHGKDVHVDLATLDPHSGSLLVTAAGGGDPALEHDVILVDPNYALPEGLDRLTGLKLALVGDIEWHFCHDARRYQEFDALVAIGSQGLAEACLRFRRPGFVGPIPAHIALLGIENAPDVNSSSRAQDREVDILVTGRQTHLAGLYPDKALLNRVLVGLPDEIAVRVHDALLPIEGYVEAMRSARYVAVSHRYGLGQSWRAFEALACGAMVLVGEDSGLMARFSRDYSTIHTFRYDDIGADLARPCALLLAVL